MAAVQLGDKEKKMVVLVAVVFVLAFVAPQFVSDYSLQYVRAQDREKASLQQKISKLQEDIDGIEDRKVILERYAKRYQSLVERDRIALPDEVQLVKEMKRIRERGKYQGIDFSFLDKISLESGATSYTSDSTIKINVAPLLLEMGMLHDMDMFMFMESLSEKISNLSFPVKCSLRLTQDDFVVADRENMRGECQINWYAVEDPESNIINKPEAAEEGQAAEETALAGN